MRAFRLAEANDRPRAGRRRAARRARRCRTTPSGSPGSTFDEIEREVFGWALRRNDGSRRRAARALGVARSTFCDKVKRYGL